MSNHFLLFLFIAFGSMHWWASHVSVSAILVLNLCLAHICGYIGAADANNQVPKCSVWILKHL